MLCLESKAVSKNIVTFPKKILCKQKKNCSPPRGEWRLKWIITYIYTYSHLPQWYHISVLVWIWYYFHQKVWNLWFWIFLCHNYCRKLFLVLPLKITTKYSKLKLFALSVQNGPKYILSINAKISLIFGPQLKCFIIIIRLSLKYSMKKVWIELRTRYEKGMIFNLDG